MTAVPPKHPEPPRTEGPDADAADLRPNPWSGEPADTAAPEPTPLDLAMMAGALALAADAAEHDEVPVGAIVYSTATGEVLGRGRNRREADRVPWAHAEYLAIQEACGRLGDWRLNHCSLAVTLEPCTMCAGLIINARLGRVIYGAHDPKAGAVRSLFRLLEDDRLNHRCEVHTGLLADDSAAMLRDFFRRLRGR